MNERHDYEQPFFERERGDVVSVEHLERELQSELVAGVRARRSAVQIARKLIEEDDQREVLALLAGGASEKEVAFALGLSAHTAHDHVKAIHRAYGARSRGELLGKLGSESPRTRLLAELA